MKKWYATTWMSCVICNCYNVRESTHWFFITAWIRAKLRAMKFASMFPQSQDPDNYEDSGIYYAVTKESLDLKGRLFG